MLSHGVYPNVHRTAFIDHRVEVYSSHNIYMEENAAINAGGIIMNTRAKFVMKKWSRAAIGLLVVTGNHMVIPGRFRSQISDEDKDMLDPEGNFDQDVIVDEDVWLGSNVTLLSGAHIGRGATIGAGGVVRGNIPPYAITIGNPAKIVGFCFKPEEIIEHEKLLYSEEERLPLELLEKNYNKYFNKRLKEIRDYSSL